MRPLAEGGAALAAAAAVPVALVGLAASPRWRDGFRRRLGSAPAAEPGAVWVHGASVGEITAAARLMDALRESGSRVVASTLTTSGLAVIQNARPDVPSALAPLDHPWCVRRALARVRPAALVIVETELWPSWIAAADRSGVPVLVVSGRISERSFPRYRAVAPLLRRTLRRLAAVGARTELDAERFARLGAPGDRIQVTGDLKLAPPDTSPRPAPEIARLLAGAPVLVGGSTHTGEEQGLLEVRGSLRAAGAPLHLALAPRHLGRVGEVAELVRGHGLSPLLRSRLPARPLAGDEVLVLDTHGELAGLYACADLAFVGGSWVGVGGHNVLEPLWCRRPVAYGPHVQNAGEGPALLEGSGAGQRVATPAALAALLSDVLASPKRWHRRVEAGLAALEPHRDSVERNCQLVRSQLRAGGPA